jgi:hypothetical protein
VNLKESRNINQKSDVGGPLHVQGNNYTKEGISNETDVFSSLSCSIHSSSIDSMIKIEVLDLRLSSDNGGCMQKIILDDGNRFINITCSENTQFAKGFFFETNTSCINLTLFNPNENGYFWFKFTGNKTIVFFIIL